MPRLTKQQWIQCRAEREAGEYFSALARKFHVDKAAIVRRANREGWGDGGNMEACIRRKMGEKVTGVSPDIPIKSRMLAIDAAAEKRAEVIKRHQEEPNAARERLYAGIRLHKQAETREEKILAFEDLKAAKIAAEALLIIQQMERKAFSLDTAAEADIIIVNPR